MESALESQKKGFTLIELLVVITLIGIVSLAWMQFSVNKVTDKERLDRLTENVSNILRSEILNNITGKSIITWGNAIYPDTTRISISTSTGILVQYYSWGTVLANGQSLTPNYYGDAGYSISDIQIWWSSTPIAVLDLRRGLDPVLTPSGTWAVITVRYHGIQKNLNYDRRTNRIEIK